MVSTSGLRESCIPILRDCSQPLPIPLATMITVLASSSGLLMLFNVTYNVELDVIEKTTTLYSLLLYKLADSYTMIVTGVH